MLAILSGILEVLIFSLPAQYWLCWIALTPLLVAILQARRAETLQLPDTPGIPRTAASFPQGFLLGYVNGILWYAGTCYWVYPTMRHYGGLNLAAALGILILFCLYLALYHGFFGGLLAFSSQPRATLSRRALVMAPFLWVGLELARARITAFPWDLLGTVQVDNVPLARIAAFTGVYGISFEIMLVNTAFAAAFLLRRERRKALLLAGLLAALVLQGGRWLKPPSVPATHKAVLVQQNIPILDSADWTRTYFESTLRDLTWISEKPTTLGQYPELIVWPESPAPFYTSDPLFRDPISEMARHTKAWVLVGSLGVRNAIESSGQKTQVLNSAALLSPTGDWIGRYDKVHLVPFGEYLPFQKLFAFAGGLTKEVGDFTPGTSRKPLTAGAQKIGVFICYESVFPDEVRQFVMQGADLLVNISNDGWYGDSGAYAQHLTQSRMRAVENGRWLLVTTNTGVTASVDPYGRVVDSLPRKTRIALLAPYDVIEVTTFYTRHGDWFAYLCAIISTVTLAFRPLFAKRPEPG